MRTPLTDMGDHLIEELMPTPIGITTEEEAQLRLQKLGCCFTSRNGGKRAWAVMFFIVVSEVFVRVWSWYLEDWDKLVISDVHWTQSPPESMRTTTLVTNIACVLHAIFIALLLCLAIHTLNQGVPKELKRLRDYKDALSECRLRVNIPELVPWEKKMWRRLALIWLICGLFFTAIRAAFSVNAFLHSDINSGQHYRQLIKEVLQKDKETRFPFSLFMGRAHFQLFVAIPQQIILGVIVSCLGSVIGLYTWLFIREVKDVLLNAQEKIGELSVSKASSLTGLDLEDIAILLADAQQKLKLVQSTSGIGLFLILGIAFPLIEIFYWLFLLSQISKLGFDLKHKDHNVGWAAVHVCLGSFGLLCWLVYYLSRNTSLCELILGDLQSLRINLHLEKRRGGKEIDAIAAPELQAKITSIEMYIRGQNGGQGMGMYVLSTRMNLTLFKTLMFSYVSILAIFREDVLHFIVGSSGA